MFKFDNTHIFTGYLKQKLSSVNLPTCKIYTTEFARYLESHGKEDPRVVESFNTINKKCLATRVNYLKNNEFYNYFWDCKEDTITDKNNLRWQQVSNIYYDVEKAIPGLTKTLYSPGPYYDTTTHEYLGDYLRFLRDYYNINLMSLYNCFNNKICSNLSLRDTNGQKDIVFNSQDAKYRIYVIPVKLFADYTIAIDSSHGIEMFCGLYNTKLDYSAKGKDLIKKTYIKVNKTIFQQPLLYDKLNVQYWNREVATTEVEIIEEAANKSTKKIPLLSEDIITHFDIVNREQDLKLFIKVPTASKSSITILEGNFKHFNDTIYSPASSESTDRKNSWTYKQNHSIVNFDNEKDTNTNSFRPITKLQLLAFNTGESYPFADRLIEYLGGSAVTPIDEISDNIKRAQRVMQQNKHYFRIEGLWEPKMQRIIYDYITNSGPIVAGTTTAISTQKDDKENFGKAINPETYTGSFKYNYTLADKRQGLHPRLGHTNKSTLYDSLGYIDRDAEKWYASWKTEDGKVKVRDTIQNVDIYNGLYDI